MSIKPLALIIEDEEDIAELYGHLLHLLGFETGHLSDGGEALLRLQECEPRLVILDLRLGSESSGPSLLAHIRSEQRLEKTHVIVISGYPRLAEEIGEAADIVLMKPVDMRQLAGLIIRLDHRLDQGEQARDAFEAYLLDRDTLRERIEFNLARTKSQVDHLFALIAIRIQAAETLTGIHYTGSATPLIRKAAARRIQRRLRLADLAARSSADDFIVMLHQVSAPDDAVKVARRLIGALDETFLVDTRQISTQSHAGVAQSSPAYADAEEMVAAAEMAMAAAIERNEPIVLAPQPG